jgi:hypothetical protein
VDGALWRMGADRQVVSLKSGGSRVNRILAAPGQQTVYAGYANGDVIEINTKSWQQESILHGSGAVREIALTDDGHTIAVATNDGVIHVGMRRNVAPGAERTTWVVLAGRARDIALASDGLLVATCTDGIVWLYSTTLQRWLCLPTGTADLGRATMAANGKVAVVLDREGRLIWIDLEVARMQLDDTNQQTPQ